MMNVAYDTLQQIPFRSCQLLSWHYLRLLMNAVLLCAWCAPLSIDISCLRSIQHQTCHTQLLWSNDRTDEQTDRHPNVTQTLLIILCRWAVPIIAVWLKLKSVLYARLVHCTVSSVHNCLYHLSEVLLNCVGTEVDTAVFKRKLNTTSETDV